MCYRACTHVKEEVTNHITRAFAKLPVNQSFISFVCSSIVEYVIEIPVRWVVSTYNDYILGYLDLLFRVVTQSEEKASHLYFFIWACYRTVVADFKVARVLIKTTCTSEEVRACALCSGVLFSP